MESNLRDFLSALEAAGELDRIKVSVSPFTEITQIAIGPAVSEMSANIVSALLI